MILIPLVLTQTRGAGHSGSSFLATIPLAGSPPELACSCLENPMDGGAW